MYEINPNTLINVLSLIIIGGLSYVIKGLIRDVKENRAFITQLVAEHNVFKEMGSSSLCPLIKNANKNKKDE